MLVQGEGSCAAPLAEAGPKSPGRRGAAASGRGCLSSGMVEADHEEEEDCCDVEVTGSGAVRERGRTGRRRRL